MKTTLSQLREQKGLSQAELAALAGISPSAIAMYETGKRTPRFAVAKRLACLLEVSMDDLVFCDSSTKEAPADA